jgi:hypothetical protein
MRTAAPAEGGVRGEGGVELGRSVELVRPRVELDEGVRQPALTANDLEPVPLELVRSGSTLAKRLALQDEPLKPLLQLVDAHV